MPHHVQRTIELLDTDTVAVKKDIGRSGRGRGAADDFMTNGRGPGACTADLAYGPDPHVVHFAFNDALCGHKLLKPGAHARRLAADPHRRSHDLVNKTALVLPRVHLPPRRDTRNGAARRTADQHGLVRPDLRHDGRRKFLAAHHVEMDGRLPRRYLAMVGVHNLRRIRNQRQISAGIVARRDVGDQILSILIAQNGHRSQTL